MSRMSQQSPGDSHPSSGLRVVDRPFLTVPYYFGDSGQLHPLEGVDRCPWSAANERCRLRKHSFRRRATGPQLPLRVMYCNVHRKYFTLYPVGYVPYERKRHSLTTLGGFIVESEGRPFEAAEQYSSDKRWVDRTARLLGISEDIDPRTAERIADELQLGASPQYWLRTSYSAAIGVEGKAKVVQEALDSLSVGPGISGRILQAGHLGGLWGKPFIWTGSHGRQAFPCYRTRVPAFDRGPP